MREKTTALVLESICSSAHCQGRESKILFRDALRVRRYWLDLKFTRAALSALTSHSASISEPAPRLKSCTVELISVQALDPPRASQDQVLSYLGIRQSDVVSHETCHTDPLAPQNHQDSRIHVPADSWQGE
jgi:hypothetical protein